MEIIVSKRFLTLLALLGIVFGVLFSFWSLSILSLLLMAVVGSWGVAIASAFFLDLLWGQPLGFFHALVLPWTVCILVVLIFRYMLSKYVHSHEQKWS